MKNICYCIGIAILATRAFAADVRVAHFSPDAPAVNILGGTSDAEKAVLLSDVPFGAVSDYLSLEAGNYFIDVVPSAGGGPVIDVNNLEIAATDTLTIASIQMAWFYINGRS